MRRLITLACVSLVLVNCQFKPSVTAKKLPFADIHIHYSFSQEEVTSIAQVLKILKNHQVEFAVVSSEPTDYAYKLASKAPRRIIAFASPYYKEGIKLRWYYDKHLLKNLDRLLRSGHYHGIGEVHLTAGIGPRPNNKNMLGLLALARQYQLPVLIHTDSSDPNYFLSFCRRYKTVRFIWAHAGGILGPKRLDRVMTQCSNVWLDLAARDPWHYGLLTDKQFKLLPGWRAFLIKYQDRIMTGTDPVWNAHQAYRWYEADEGWNHYTQFINFHRTWLKQLPPKVERKIRIDNARRFFNRLN